MSETDTSSDNGRLPFALHFGQRPTVTDREECEPEYVFKVTQTIPHMTKPRTPLKPTKFDKN